MLCLCIGLSRCAFAQEAVGFKGKILFADGQELAFEYIGIETGPMGGLELRGSLGDRAVSYPLESLRSVHVICPDGKTVQHVEVIGRTGTMVTIQNPWLHYVPPRASATSCLGIPSFVYLDRVTGLRQVHASTVWPKISMVLIDSQNGRYRWNPVTKRYFPSYYLYDPYDGTALQWMDQPPQNAAAGQANDAMEQARLELQEAEKALWAAYDEAKAAYDALKSTKGTEAFQSIEGAITEASANAGQDLMLELGKIAAEREVGQKLGEEAGKQASGFVAFVGAAKTYFDIGQWLAKDSVLITRNVRSNWLTLTKVWPAKRRYDAAKKRLNDLERS
jgi:hypothetical protein